MTDSSQSGSAQLKELMGRVLQLFVQGEDATVMLFTEMAEAEEWLEAMMKREK